MLSIPEAPHEEESTNESSGCLNVDTGVFSISDQRSRATKQFYLFLVMETGKRCFGFSTDI
jgi:hypothetical protein